MFQRVRSTGLALGVVTTASAAVLLAAVPASAATAPDWPSSRLPTGAGCAITAYSPYSSTVSGLNEYTFTDSQVPVVTGWTMNNQQSVLTLVPGTTLVTTRITATQSCSGVGSVASGLVVGTTRLSDDVPFLRASTDAFRSVWASSNPLTPANAGAYRMPTAIVAPRYASFVLTDVWKLVGKSDFVGTPAIVTGPWSTKVLYVQRHHAGHRREPHQRGEGREGHLPLDPAQGRRRPPTSRRPAHRWRSRPGCRAVPGRPARGSARTHQGSRPTRSHRRGRCPGAGSTQARGREASPPRRSPPPRPSRSSDPPGPEYLVQRSLPRPPERPLRQVLASNGRWDATVGTAHPPVFIQV